ncbi:DUF1127 domain-containing protein [Pseudorhodoplanes sinuspersici]|uniref:YjiS-like domain-containing protein n=1 Tax=Pseudorhodoplanes sinuspersici TaxID=1235591 RepID=A0A1W6ZXY5_9HYPH|nr:DUF1127 domain-containing protein [Pseudorhodoplanes sinuspersici]ARQ02173.1 hypothetical protein CAK95_26045 [Pseudorhodoplanes sinuspersici]RKE73986.1 uncharacterized protein DUF1127 [Pseudorhodoplanes sinuspersici]
MDQKSDYEKLQADLRSGRIAPYDLIYRARVVRSQMILRDLRACFASIRVYLARRISRLRKLQSLRELNGYDDRLLRDIGVTRYDINAAIRSVQRDCDDIGHGEK